MKVISLYAGPGSGKSTTAAGLFFKMKSLGINSELVTEYAKKLAWEKNDKLCMDQLYVTAKQNRGLERLRGQVDYAITDSPLPLAIHYAGDYHLKTFEPLVMELFNSYENINFFLNRKKKYNPAGRFQNEEEAIQIDFSIKKLMFKHNIPFVEVDADEHVVETILKYLKI